MATSCLLKGGGKKTLKDGVVVLVVLLSLGQQSQWFTLSEESDENLDDIGLYWSSDVGA